MREVAGLLGVHAATVSRLMDRGKLGYYQIGTRRVVGHSHLQRYLELVERPAKAKSIA